MKLCLFNSSFFRPGAKFKITLTSKVLGFDGGSSVKTKAEDAVFKKFDDEDVSVIDKKIVEHDDEDLDYFKSLATKE